MARPSLDSEITRVLDPKTAWKGLRDFCDENIEKLGDQLCIGENEGKGVLFGKRTGISKSDNGWLRAIVNKKNLEREVGLSYALFNARCKPPIRGCQIISWEAPLLRPTTGHLDICTVKCDLVAYNKRKKQLVAIEVKLKPGNPATNMQHGLLQAMVYGHILHQHLKRNRPELERQVQNCRNQWCLQKAQSPPVESVAYALAAPKEYFSESLRMYGEEGVEWIRKATRTKDVPFAGFWVLEYDEVISSQEIGKSQCVPTINCSIKRISSVMDLVNHCDRA